MWGPLLLLLALAGTLNAIPTTSQEESREFQDLAKDIEAEPRDDADLDDEDSELELKTCPNFCCQEKCGNDTREYKNPCSHGKVCCGPNIQISGRTAKKLTLDDIYKVLSEKDLKKEEIHIDKIFTVDRHGKREYGSASDFGYTDTEKAALYTNAIDQASHFIYNDLYSPYGRHGYGHGYHGGYGHHGHHGHGHHGHGYGHHGHGHHGHGYGHHGHHGGFGHHGGYGHGHHGGFGHHGGYGHGHHGGFGHHGGYGHGHHGGFGHGHHGAKYSEGSYRKEYIDPYRGSYLKEEYMYGSGKKAGAQQAGGPTYTSQSDQSSQQTYGQQQSYTRIQPAHMQQSYTGQSAHKQDGYGGQNVQPKIEPLKQYIKPRNYQNM